ncbi:hypothetical protein PYK79_47250 [Streptomyces sp. ID05-04B]|uniref:hypothetical protein n=1 Tax=Streptomyces sp. ID05-04B TaxID=3028661 RepID=UPI0029C1AD2F|nr:hypothetical protein [Streptomyces sp. ID05-04B]MDX5569351.1 hypothetical protein [Streptomyces sp. ID05-04B]
MPDRGAPPDDGTQSDISLGARVEFVDKLPGGRAYMLLATKARAVCLAVRTRFTAESRTQAARDIEALESLGLWPQRGKPPGS